MLTLGPELREHDPLVKAFLQTGDATLIRRGRQSWILVRFARDAGSALARAILTPEPQHVPIVAVPFVVHEDAAPACAPASGTRIVSAPRAA